jgi:hypothetical protein
MQLIRKPVEPRRNPLMLLRLQSPKYHSWRVFLNEPADRRAPQLAAVEA